LHPGRQRSGEVHVDARRSRLAPAHTLKALDPIQDAMDLVTDAVSITEE